MTSPLAKAVLHANGAAVFDQDLPGHGAGVQFQVGSLLTGLEVGTGSALASAVADIVLVIASAFLADTIKILVIRQAGLNAGLDKNIRQFQLFLVGNL